MITCVDCGEDMHGRPTTWGRCGDCHRAYMRKTEPWTPSAPTAEGRYEAQARESEAWRESLRRTKVVIDT